MSKISNRFCEGLQPMKDYVSYDVLGFGNKRKSVSCSIPHGPGSILSVQASSVASESEHIFTTWNHLDVMRVDIDSTQLHLNCHWTLKMVSLMTEVANRMKPSK
ncbi:hypothetical protein Tco_0150672 [Tanacetum coccineum]